MQLTTKQQGQGMVEYALIIVLIAITTMGVMYLVGIDILEIFDRIRVTLGG